MFLKELYIQNFRGIESQNLEFTDGINLIIGNNGAGKTSILSAAAITLGFLTHSLTRKGNLKISKSDVRYIQKKISVSVSEFESVYPVVVESKVDFDDTIVQFGQNIEDVSEIQRLRHKKMSLEKSELLKVLKGVYPLISYQRFDREWKIKPGDNRNQITVDFGAVSRESGYENCLSGIGYENIIQRWCLKMALMEFERKSEIREFKLFQRIVELFIQQLEDNDRDIKVYYSSEIGGLIYDDGVTRMPLYDLSTGYRAVLSMIMELAYRAVVLNPEMPEDLQGIRGIVLIDEIDAHLHPKWQWRILDALKATFPHVQFIVATHSPMIISSAKNANIINLDEDRGVTYLDSAYGFSTGDVLTLRQGTVDMPVEAKMQLDALEKALDNADDERARSILAKARDEYGEDSAFYAELYQTYNLNSWMDN